MEVQVDSESTSVLGIERGRATPEELAAITVVLLARSTGPGDAGGSGAGRPGRKPVPASARWHRLGRRAFQVPHSWQS